MEENASNVRGKKDKTQVCIQTSFRTHKHPSTILLLHNRLMKRRPFHKSLLHEVPMGHNDSVDQSLVHHLWAEELPG
jgi:hypothetical protein